MDLKLVKSVPHSRPLTIVTKETPFLFGGAPPEGMIPIDRTKRFLATVPAGKGSVASVFVHPLVGMDFDFIWDNKGVLHDAPSSILEIIEHLPAKRSQSGGGCISVLPPLFLDIGEEQVDVVDGMPYGHHKVGGIPFSRDASPSLLEECNSLICLGYLQIFQLMFPDSHDATIDQTWPFEDFGFHLFMPPDRASNFKCCWV